MPSPIDDSVRAFESHLALPAGFYDKLLDEDDWSLVIKLNALIESACAEAIRAHVRPTELAERLSSVDLANGRYGKLALLESLGAISKDQRKSVEELAGLRNRLVHDVRQVSFSLPKYVRELDKDSRDRFADRFGLGIREFVRVPSAEIPRHQFVCENPKLSIWLTFSEIFACLHLELGIAELRRELAVPMKPTNLLNDSAGSTHPPTLPDRSM